MDVSRLRRGEQIAGISGVALILIMFIFDWFSLSAVGGGPSFGGNAWDTMEVIRWVLLLTAIAGVALAVLAITQSEIDLPVATSAIAAGLGILSVILILYRIIDPPDEGLGDLADVSRSVGVFLGLIAAGGIAYGSWAAMQEEGAAYSSPGTQPGPPPPPQPPAA